MGMTAVAQETQPGRPSLYKALSGDRDHRIGTAMRVRIECFLDTREAYIEMMHRHG